ncbi:MAG: DUF975 family protein [Streptococcaceae bacterium]|jgi:uncharacterized membrane protein|nr:DUF975 family protein [Streptococcaceae bacterium]
MTRKEMKKQAKAALRNFYGAKMLLVIFSILGMGYGTASSVVRNFTGNTTEASGNLGFGSINIDALLVFGVLLIVFSLLVAVAVLSLVIFLQILVVGGQWKYLEIFRGGPENDEKPAFSSIAKAYKDGTWPKVYAFLIVEGLILIGLTIVPIVGWIFLIYFALGWSQAVYVLHDQLEDGSYAGPLGVLRASSALMRGYRWNYFVFLLSFILWDLLVGVTFGLASFWVSPYTIMTRAIYYHQRLNGKF